jgi:predicted dehydrogenase
MTTPIRVALIGCGDISPEHLRTYSKLGLQLVAICDLDRARADKRKAESGQNPEIYSDHTQMLARNDIDLVTVATPVAMHTPLTLAALASGRHVVCEKPSALSLAENVAIRDSARKHKKTVVFCSSRMRYGVAETAKQFMPKVGKAYQIDVHMARRRGRPGVDIIQDARWFVDQKRAGGGVVMDMGQYFMDSVLNFAGWPEITAVSAMDFRGFPHQLPAGTTFDVEEQMTILARTATGCTFTFDLSWIGHQKPRMDASIRGVDGGITIDWQPGDKGHPFTFFHDGATPWQWLDTSTASHDKTESNVRLYADVCKAIRGETVDLGTTPDQAIVITRLTLMAQLSAKLKREVKAEEVPIPALAASA